jgi:hypothetical protein
MHMLTVQRYSAIVGKHLQVCYNQSCRTVSLLAQQVNASKHLIQETKKSPCNTLQQLVCSRLTWQLLQLADSCLA